MVKTPLSLHAYFFIGVAALGLSSVNGLLTANANNTTLAPLVISTTAPITVVPVTHNPATWYGHFNVSNGDNKTCILLDIACFILIEHKKSKAIEFVLPTNAVPTGKCANADSSISLSWSDRAVNLTLSMSFKKVTGKWVSSSVSFTAANGSGIIEDTMTNDTNLMSATNGKSYKCDITKEITMLDVTVRVNMIQVQPFGGEFGEADTCAASSGGTPAPPVDTVVPIAVGCVLLGLVAILIITYFVGRCKRTGYEKM